MCLSKNLRENNRKRRDGNGRQDHLFQCLFFYFLIIRNLTTLHSLQVVLRAELERHAVPYYMVRTKVRVPAQCSFVQRCRLIAESKEISFSLQVDQDIANNKEDSLFRRFSSFRRLFHWEDNFTDKHDTLKQIRDDLEKTHKVETSSCVVKEVR